MAILTALAGIAAFFALPIAALATGRRRAATPMVYFASFAVSLVLFANALTALLGNLQSQSLVLPLGLPWTGSHFRLDALAAFFLVVINLGGAAASFYAIGYGRDETAPLRVLPLFPAFLAGMNLVVVADDAFTFLFAWELMSICSWVLVMAHHRATETARAGYVYLVMASFGTLCLLLAFGLLAGTNQNFLFEAVRGGAHAPAMAAVVLRPVTCRR
jgi:formate hydrogenlyase subunit 3/multisubunit Na+/H+ antiporter MnhD subunit